MPKKKYDLAYAIKNQEKQIAENKRAIKRNIRKAYHAGRTVPYSLRTLIESGVSLDVIRKVYRKP